MEEAQAPLLTLGAPSRRSQTAHVFARETIRVAILNGQLKGGTRLVQSDLASQLKVSTTPVREALRDLASEGMIRIDPHRGGVVCELDANDLNEVYEIRLQLEPLVLKLAIEGMTEEALDHAAELHDAMNAAPDSAAWVELNRNFHMSLYQMANRPRLLSLVRSLQDASVMAVSARLRRDPNQRRIANAEHGELLKALRNRDLETSIEIIHEHLTTSVRLESAERTNTEAF